MHRVTEEIIANNEWRDRDFAKFKINPSKVEEELWCRMAIPMIYAHWEGFVVSALKTLIDYLNTLELEAKSVDTKFIVISLGDAFQSLSGKQSFTQRTEFTDKFNNLLKESLKFQKKINTKSNLKSDVLEDICKMYGFRYANFSSITGDIDRLVHVRNSIAHGENSFVPTSENIEKYIKSVSDASDVFREEIENFLSEKIYLSK